MTPDPRLPALRWWKHPVLWWRDQMEQLAAVQQMRDSGQLRPITIAISADPNFKPYVVDTPEATVAIGEVVKTAVAKLRRKGLGPKQLKWLRTNIEAFKDMEAKSKAAKSGVMPIGGKAKK